MAASDDIKARVDIVDVAADYAPDLKKAGRNFHACCPFHQERTPSFVVFPDRQSWHCFGACATGGDVFSLVMRADNTDFLGALKTLADRAGVALPDRRKTEAVQNPIYEVNEAALRFFRDALQADKGSLARAYVQQRGMSDEAVVHFDIGYAAGTDDGMLTRLQALGFSEELIVSAGLATRMDSGAARDMLRGRLTFVLRDVDGRIAGFAGRSLDGSQPKYLNTPQTAVFDKGRMLYGLDRARDAIGREGVAVVVEGYMDVITAHEHGYQNVVASMGTALTDEQVSLLRARAPRIVLALDADAAGQEAMLRSLRSSWQLLGTELQSARGRARADILQRGSDLDTLRVALITDGKDPDELIRNNPARWHRLIADAVPVVDFLMTSETRRADLSTAQGKTDAVENIMPMIYAIPNFADQDRYFQRLAGLIGVPVATLEAGVGRTNTLVRPRDRRRDAPDARRAAVESVLRTADREPIEEYALALLAQYPELVERSVEMDAEHLKRPENRALLSAIQRAGTIEGTYSELDGDLTERLEELSGRNLPPADPKQRVADWVACVRRLEERYLRGLKFQEEGALAPPSAEEAPHDAEYVDSVFRQGLRTNERLRDLFVSGGKP